MIFDRLCQATAAILDEECPRQLPGHGGDIVAVIWGRHQTQHDTCIVDIPQSRQRQGLPNLRLPLFLYNPAKSLCVLALTLIFRNHTQMKYDLDPLTAGFVVPFQLVVILHKPPVTPSSVPLLMITRAVPIGSPQCERYSSQPSMLVLSSPAHAMIGFGCGRSSTSSWPPGKPVFPHFN